MAKLCPKGKAAAKRKFKVYPSAYANMYASGVCSGKIKPGGRKKAKDGGIQKAGLARRKRCLLRKWVSEKWVDIGAPKKDGKYQPCGRSKGSKRKYPKCVPLAKATRMTKGAKGLCCQTKESCR